LVCLSIAAVAWLYASVGHAGASGYIAVLTLFGMAPAEIKPLALLLNVLVASIGTIQFYRAGHFSWHLFWPFALMAVPMAFFGGAMQLPTDGFKMLLGVVLGLSALWLIRSPSEEESTQSPPLGVALGAGAGIGLLSGLTGTGGGIFLTPLLLVMGWAKTKTASAISALFILLNSLSGLAGVWSAGGTVPPSFWTLAIAVVIGGFIGATLGSFRLAVRSARGLLAVVMGIAAYKLLTT
jgi:uncharacterized protein